MKNKFLILVCGLIVLLSGCSKNCCLNQCNNGKTCSIKKDTIMEANKEKEVLACTLTNVEMKERKKTLENFKNLIKEKKILKTE